MVIYQHDSAIAHTVPTGHPERPDRLIRLTEMLDKDFGDVARKQAPLASEAQLALIHDQTYLEHLLILICFL